MKSPNETDASVSHLRFSSAKIAARMDTETSQRVMGDFTWTPSSEQLAAANVARLARSLGCADYEALHRVSIDEPDRFWRAVVDDLAIPLDKEDVGAQPRQNGRPRHPAAAGDDRHAPGLPLVQLRPPRRKMRQTFDHVRHINRLAHGAASLAA